MPLLYILALSVALGACQTARQQTPIQTVGSGVQPKASPRVSLEAIEHDSFKGLAREAQQAFALYLSEVPAPADPSADPAYQSAQGAAAMPVDDMATIMADEGFDDFVAEQDTAPASEAKHDMSDSELTGYIAGGGLIGIGALGSIAKYRKHRQVRQKFGTFQFGPAVAKQQALLDKTLAQMKEMADLKKFAMSTEHATAPEVAESTLSDQLKQLTRTANPDDAELIKAAETMKISDIETLLINRHMAQAKELNKLKSSEFRAATPELRQQEISGGIFVATAVAGVATTVAAAVLELSGDSPLRRLMASLAAIETRLSLLRHKSR